MKIPSNLTPPILTGLIGWPVAQSLSPVIHGAWISEYGLSGHYHPFAVAPDRLGDALKALSALGIRGVNVTIPHKQAVLPYLDELDSVAARLQAVNTIVVSETGHLHGLNTDMVGFKAHLLESLSNANRSIADIMPHALVLGAGGAAPAVVAALIDMGLQAITVANRTHNKAVQLCKQFEDCLGSTILKSLEWKHVTDILPEMTLLVNTTSLGMAGMPPMSEELNLDLVGMPKSAVVYDIVYKPLQTDLLEAASRAGLLAIDGLGMLLHQAVPSFQAWHGVRPRVTEDLRLELVNILNPSAKKP